MKIWAVCSDVEGRLPPSHGFGVLLESGLLFDSCDRESAERFSKISPIRPVLGVSAVDNQHHNGGFEAFEVPVIRWRDRELVLKLGGVVHKIVGFGRESLLLVGRTVVSPCGLFTIPFGALSSMRIKADCFVGGLGGSTASPYAVSRIIGELRALGVRCVVPLHSPRGIVRELERRFNVYTLAAGLEIEIPI